MNERGAEREQSGDSPERLNEERQPKPRIYVASLSDYNEGRLHGAWIDANQSEEELAAAVTAMLDESPVPIAEEWAIHDYEDFAPLRLHEFESLAVVTRLAAGIAKYGRAFAAWADHVGVEDASPDQFEDCYIGEYESGAAFVEALLDDSGLIETALEQLPEDLRPFTRFDFQAYFESLDAGGEIVAVEGPSGAVYVFRNL